MEGSNLKYDLELLNVIKALWTFFSFQIPGPTVISEAPLLALIYRTMSL